MIEETTKPVVWIINSQHWPRAFLRAELIERGFEAIGYIALSHALAALFHPDIVKPDIVVLELREQVLKRDELEALTRKGIPTIVLGGAMELNEKLVNEFEWAASICRPFTIGAVADVIEELI